MADEKIVTSIVANSNFSNLIADLQRVTSSLHNLQQEFAGGNRALAGQIAATNAMFAETMRKTGQYSTHFVSLTSDVEKFGKSLDGGRLKLGDYFRVYQDHVRTSGGLIRDLAKQQVQLQNAVLQPLGRNAQGLMQYNVHIPRGLDLTRNKAAVLKQELQIMNKVIQDGGVQLINWGKNTQWAGRQLTVGLTLPLVAFGKAAADAFKVADQELTRLTKVYGDVAGTSAQELAKVRKDVAATAKELSSAMGVNFAETISLAADIAATGKTGNELLSSVSETTRLAVLGEVDRQEAMKATLAIQSAFKQNTEQLAESINFLNAVENQTSTTLNDLVEAIPKAGPVIKGLGGDIEDLALYLTAMREGGINASEGANALKSALASLINPTDVAVKKFQGFGIDLLGIVQKNAGSTTDTLFALQAALDKLNPLAKQQAIEQLFGKFQYSRLNALFENLGRQGSQTLQVLDLMKASAGELEAVAGRELAQVTESAAGRYKRAVEGLKADLAGVGDEFLNIATKLINVLDKVIQFGQKLPDPIKKILAFGGAFTAIIGPVIMLTGVLANFFGYIIKGLGHFKALFKGAEGFKLLTPEIMAAQHAGSLLGDEFYNDAKAAETLRLAIRKLAEDLVLLQKNASGATAATTGLGQVVATTAGTPVSVVGGPSLLRSADPSHPLIGGTGRAAAHINPRDPNNPATIFGLSLQPEPLNRVIGRTPQILMTERLPGVEGLTEVGGRSTGIVAGEHARYAALMATLGLQSKAEIEQLKKTIRFGGQVSSDFVATFDDILPLTTEISNNAAAQSAAIVAELRAGKITVEQAKAKIIAVNAELERMMGEAVVAYGAGRGRTIDLTKAPLIDQPVVDATGKPNLRGMFRQGIFRDVMQAAGRATRTRTYGGPYSIETTRPNLPPGYTISPSGLILPPGYIKGGDVAPLYFTNGETVPGPNINADVVPAMLTPGEFVLTRGTVAREGADAVEALHRGEATIVPKYNTGGRVSGVQYLNGAGSVRSMIPVQSIMSMFPGRFRPGLNKSQYEVKGTAGVFGGSFTNPEVAKRFDALLKSRGKKGLRSDAVTREKINALMRGEGVPPDILLLSMMSGTGSRRTSTDEFLSAMVGAIDPRTGLPLMSSAEARILSDRIFEAYARRVGEMDLVNDLNNPIWHVSDLALSGQHPLVLEAWQRFSATPGMLAGPSRGSLSFLESFVLSNGTVVNFDKLKGSRTETFYHSGKPDPLRTILRSRGYNMGGRVPGYVNGRSVAGLPKAIIDAITKNWGRVRGVDKLSNDDPLHGPIQIGKFVHPKDTRLGRRGQRIFHARPGATSSVTAFLTGSLEERGRYVTQQYMLGDYDVLRIPGAIEAMKAWGKKATGTFYRGINFRKFSSGPRPLPDWLEAEIKLAQQTGDFSGLIGKEFIMRRSSWTSSPKIANEFGDFQIVADVKNRRVTPSSEMFPDIKFVPKADQKKPKAKKLAAARSEEESIFGGKFRIVSADKDGIRVETVAGPMGGNRRFGGPVNAGTPYVVGENGPELFVPKSSGGIIPGYKMGGSVAGGYGYARGVQNKILGGGILRILGALGIAMGGQKVGEKVGGAPGTAISTASSFLPFMMMGMPGRTPDISRAYDKSIFNNTKLGQSFVGTAMMGGKLSSSLSKLALGLTKFNLIATIVVGVGAGLFKMWKNAKDSADAASSSFGLNAEEAQKAGLKYIDYSQKIKDAVDAQKLFLDQNKLTYQSMARANTPFEMTITEYKKLRKEVKETMGQQIEILNRASNKDVARVIVQIKEQLVAAGLSAQEATKRIYAMMQLSNKASLTTSAMATSRFTGITGPQAAAASALETFAFARDFTPKMGKAEAELNAFNNAMMAIDTSVKDIYDKSEKAAKKKKQDFDETIGLYNAEKAALDSINSKKINQREIGSSLLNQLVAQNPELSKFINSQDTIVSMWQKIRIATRGYTGDLERLNAVQTEQLYKLTVEVGKAVSQTNRTGILKSQYAEYDRLFELQKRLAAATKGQSVREQIDARDAIRAIDKKIKKINEEAEARKKALREEAQAENVAIRVQQQRLEYEQRLAAGDLPGAAASQFELQKLLNEQQLVIAEQAIEDQRVKDVTPLEKQKERLQREQEKMADAAALAGESLQSVTEKLDKQKQKIENVNDAMSALKIAVDLNKKDLDKYKQSEEFKGLVANFIDAAKKAGISVPADGYTYTGGAAGVVKTGATTDFALNALTNANVSINSILAQKDINISSTTGKITINGATVNFGTGTFKSPFSAGKVTDYTNAPDLKGWRTTSGSNSQSQLVKQIAQSKNYKPGEYFTLTDESGKVYVFKVREDKNITMVTDPYQNKAMGGPIRGFSSGTTDGPVFGPGSGTSDSILARLSNGEFVTKATSVSDIGVSNMHLVNTMGSAGIIKAAQNLIQGKAQGGYIQGFKDGGISNARTHITNWNQEKIPIMPRGVAKPGIEYAIAPDKNYPIDHIKSPMGSLQRFIDIAKSQIGSGHNYKIVDKEGTEWDVDANKYTTYVNDIYKLGSDVLYWCGAFIAWAAANSGVKISDKMFSAFQASQEYKKKGMFNDLSKIENIKNVKPGDIAWFDFVKAQTPGVPDHASIVTGKTKDSIRAIGQLGMGRVAERSWNLNELFGSARPEGFARGGYIPGYPMGGLIPYFKNGGAPHEMAMRNQGNPRKLNWFQNYVKKLTKSSEQLPSWARDPFGMAQIFRKIAGQQKEGDNPALAAALLPLNFMGSGIGAGAKLGITGAGNAVMSSTKASTTIMRNLRKAMIESALNAGRSVPNLDMKDSLKMSTSMLLESSDAGAAFRKYWGKAYDILVEAKNPVVNGMSKDDFLKNIVNSTEDATTRWKGTGFSLGEGPSSSQIDKPSDFIKAANIAYLQAHGLSASQPLAMFRAVRAPWNQANYIDGVRMTEPSLTPEEIISSNLAHELGGYWSLSSRMGASYLRNLNITKSGLLDTSYGGLYRADIPIESFPSPVGMGGMTEEYANVFNPATIDSLRSATRIGRGWADDLSSIYHGPQRYLRILDFYKSALIPSKGKIAPDIVEKIKSNLTPYEIDLVFNDLLKEFSSLGGRLIPLSSNFMKAMPPIGVDKWMEVIKKVEAILGQPLLTPKLAGGGYINPSYYSSMSMPSYYTGAKYVYDDTIAQLHKGEMVVPSSMNPNNPFATNTGTGVTYYIQPTINAAPGMDENALASAAAQKVHEMFKQTESKIGTQRNISRRYTI